MKRCILVVSLVLALAGASGTLVTSLLPESAFADTTVTVQVGDFWFCNSSFEDGVCETDIHAGDTVVWNMASAASQHTTTSDASGWDSGRINPGGTFQFRFSQPGTYLYHCNVHPDQMRGRIVVAAAATATSPPGGQTPAAGPTPTAVLITDGPPVTGSGPQSGSTSWWWLALAIGGGGLIAIRASTLRRRA